MNLTYNEAFEELTGLMDQLEDDSIQLDTLAVKIKQAKVLIEFCEIKLRSIDDDLQSVSPLQ